MMQTTSHGNLVNFAKMVINVIDSLMYILYTSELIWLYRAIRYTHNRLSNLKS